MDKSKLTPSSTVPEFWYVQIANWNLIPDDGSYRYEEVRGSYSPMATCIQGIKYEVYEDLKEKLTGGFKTVSRTRYTKAPIIVEVINKEYVKDIITGKIYADATNYKKEIVRKDIIIKRTKQIEPGKLADYLRTFTELDFIRYEKAIRSIESNLLKGFRQYHQNIINENKKANEDIEFIKQFKRIHHKKDNE